MNGESVIIPLSEIEESPGPYAMSFGYDPGPMLESVRRVGVLNPPLVERDKEGRAVVVLGQRRVMALRGVGEEKTRCVDLSGSTLPAAERLLLALHDNLATRALNGAEKAMVLERLLGHFEEGDVLRFYMPRLGLPAHRPTLRDYVRMNGLEPAVRVAFAEGRLSFRTIRSLLEMDPESRDACFRWLSNVTLNMNHQAQFIELVLELSSSTGKSMAHYLEEELLSRILSSTDLNGPQKARATLDYLRSQRMPNLSRAEKRFQAMTRSLMLPEGVALSHSPFFESPDYRLEIRFRDGEALMEKVRALAGNERLERITDPWKGGGG